MLSGEYGAISETRLRSVPARNNPYPSCLVLPRLPGSSFELCSTQASAESSVPPLRGRGSTWTVVHVHQTSLGKLSADLDQCIGSEQLPHTSGPEQEPKISALRYSEASKVLSNVANA